MKASLWRSRWAAIGAAVAVTLGAGGLMTASATSAQSVFVAINPARVLDTRYDVGLTGPFTTGTARELDVTGTITVVLPDGTTGTGAPVPDGATAVALNVTAVQPTALGHVAVRPGGATGAPTTSNININNPGGVWPNAVTVEVGGNGKINLYYYGNTSNATTNMIVDIVGYYTAGQGTPGPKGDKGDTGPAGLSYVATFDSGDTTALGPDYPPPAPAGYTFSTDLAPGRYYATGDLTIKNVDNTKLGMAVCAFFVGDTQVNNVSLASMPISGVDDSFAVFPVAITFEVTTGGVIDFGMRCNEEGESSDLVYWYANLTLFATG